MCRVSAVLWGRLPVFCGFESRGFQPSSKSGKGGVGFWAVPLAARMWLAVSSPSALELSTLCTLEWQAFLCEESRREDICESHKYPVTGIQENRNSRSHAVSWHLAVIQDCWSLVWICLLREVCFVRDSLLSWDTSKTIIIMGQADVSRPVNPDALGE